VLNDPAAELRIPRKCQPGRTMRPLTEKEVGTYPEVFDLREKLISRLAFFEGLRPGERFLLFAGRRSQTTLSAWRSASQTGFERAEK
jgi:hypothetical protein